jgi:pyrroloquinoline-quinone synthase
MNLRARLDDAIRPYDLLTHPFYQAWSKGELPRANLQRYAGQYYHHVLAFPTYVSAVHSRSGEDLVSRRALLENLIEEERGEHNHAALWLQFAAGIGAPANDVAAGAPEASTRALIDTFRSLCREELPAGAAALYAYESQVPRVASAKIEGLVKYFGVSDPKALEFFSVHKELDQWHSDTTAEIVERNATEPDVAVAAAGNAAKALWGFLDSMQA